MRGNLTGMAVQTEVDNPVSIECAKAPIISSMISFAITVAILRSVWAV